MFINPGELCAGNHPFPIEFAIEKADVVGDRAGQKLILPHDRADCSR